MSHQYHIRTDGDGAGVMMHGYLRRIHGRFYVDEAPIDDLIGSHEGQFVELCLFRPDQFSYPMDPKIAPLVTKLNDLGVPTLSSCEGHAEPDRPQTPYVVCAEPVPLAFLPDGWHCSQIHSSSWRAEPDN